MAVKKVTKKPEATETDTAANFAAFDVADMTETYRKMAETSMEKAQAGFETVKTASEEATKAMEQSFDVVKNDGTELSLKAIDVVRDGLSTSLEHAEKLMGVTSFAEVIELQSTFAREQAENLIAQTKSFHTASQDMAEKAVAPVKAAVENSAKYLKAV